MQRIFLSDKSQRVEESAQGIEERGSTKDSCQESPIIGDG